MKKGTEAAPLSASEIEFIKASGLELPETVEPLSGDNIILANITKLILRTARMDGQTSMISTELSSIILAVFVLLYYPQAYHVVDAITAAIDAINQENLAYRKSLN